MSNDKENEIIDKLKNAILEGEVYAAPEVTQEALNAGVTGVPPFLVPPRMRDFLLSPLVARPLLPGSFRGTFWQIPPVLGNPASCADGSYCTPA